MTMIWLGVAVAALIVEAITAQLAAIWFVPSALIALVLDLVGAPLWLQITVFTVVSAFCVAVLYRKLRRNIAAKCEKTNLDALIGATAKVEEAIPGDGVGRVSVRGISWKATCTQYAAVGENVRILAIDGVTLHCEPTDVEQVQPEKQKQTV